MNFATPSRAAVRRIVLSAILLLGSSARLLAGSGTWLTAPSSGNWNTAGNWAGGVIPGNASTDTATFGGSSVTDVTISGNLLINEFAFTVGGSAFSFTVKGQLLLTGAGVTNSSGSTQNFVNSGEAFPSNGAMSFAGTASAGTNSNIVNNGGTGAAGTGGRVSFYGGASAGSATFTNKAGTADSYNSGTTSFYDRSTAADATITNLAPSASADSGRTFFRDDATAGRAHFRNSGAIASGGGVIEFRERSSGGDGTFVNEGGFPRVGGGFTAFEDASTAGHGNYTNLGGALFSAGSGGISFTGTSNAGTGTFVNEGATADSAFGGQINFNDSTSAASATFTNNGSARVDGNSSGSTAFFTTATAASATLIAHDGSGTGGRISFFGDSTGGTARVEVFGKGSLDLGNHNGPSLSLGSIEGSGIVFLGSKNLVVGANNLDTTFSGLVQDGGPFGGGGGSFTKTGRGTLTLAGASLFTGGTTISAGEILANNASGSALGTGAVTVAGGATLGGDGFIGGLTTVASGGHLTPGNPTGALTFLNGLTLSAGAVVDIRLGTASSSIEVSRGMLVTASAPGGITINLSDAGGFTGGVPYALIRFGVGLASGSSLAAFTLGRVIGADTASDYTLSLTDTALIVTRKGATRLANIAARAYCGTGNAVTIGGFVVSGVVPKRVLVRAIGPSLTAQGIGTTEAMPNPVVEVHDANHGNSIIATNDNWGDNANLADITATAASIGASALLGNDTTSAALLLTVPPGVYSFVVSGKAAGPGIVLLEVYDADTAATGSNFVNIAARAQAKTGNGVTIGGFVISGNASKHVLLRAVGPTLTKQGLGVTEVLADPTIELHDANHGNVVLATNDNWGDNANFAAITTTGARIGATPFDSSDTTSAALLITLPPGVYSFVASGKAGASGIVLVEVYDAD